MAAKERFPRLDVEITPERWETAVTATSGGCLIADAIKSSYPQFTGVLVDTATITLSDKAAGRRYTYLTPETARNLLLYFDQGWSQPGEHTVRLKTPVKAVKLTRSRPAKAARQERLATLQAKRDSGETLTGTERRALTNMETADAAGYAELPHTTGPITDVIRRREGNHTVVGGSPLPAKRPHPNMLAGRNRIYGAKTAQPAKVFVEAVEVEVQRRLAAMQ
jgi:hypothetical protein